MSEATLQEHVRRLSRQFGWLYYHTHRAQHSPAGFPDCVMVRDEWLIFAELKRQASRYRPTIEQQMWLVRLGHIAQIFDRVTDTPRIDVFLWRPMDLFDGTIAATLAP
jgi:hypothetical protein